MKIGLPRQYCPALLGSIEHQRLSTLVHHVVMPNEVKDLTLFML